MLVAYVTFLFWCTSYLLGTVTSTELLKKLRDAIRKGDKDILRKAIHESVAAAIPELDSTIQRARDILNLLEASSSGDVKVRRPDALRAKLRKAARERDREALAQLIAELEMARFPELSSDLRRARDTLESLGGGRGG